MPELRSVLIVCPTEYGGQIEHAADLAIAVAARPDVESCILLSRPGAHDYLGELNTPGLTVLEKLPPRRHGSGALAKLSKSVLQVVDLLREHVIVRQIAGASPQPLTMVLETTKYPLPRLLTPGSGSTVVLFVHNAKPHFDLAEATLRQKFLLRLERWCLDGSDWAVTHGLSQKATIASYSNTPVQSVPLPKSSALPAAQSLSDGELLTRRAAALLPQGWSIDEPFALCIGELRPNKGIELAIKAAGIAGVRLLIAGKSDDEDLAKSLEALASAYPLVEIRDAFLEAVEFEALLHTAAVVVLPYTHFDAQSGVLSKAMNAGTAVLASDLPALRDQAGEYSRITFGNAEDAEDFAQATLKAFSAPYSAHEDSLEQDRLGGQGTQETDAADEWQRVAAAVVDHATS